ncbi:histidine kinase dimerization/phospho-acceptor domain-containing protein [Haloarcula sp. JP-L23]|uniref:histidine kinase dimerization/phospho-acceptor domain-containing protein n=1 Tax=Haloarcula sp. JP-L23 TaxID=2716717 RepID=UPI00140EF1E1|nr:PAS domain S-box protein [Haloarcula sp. JP-L23]
METDDSRQVRALFTDSGVALDAVEAVLAERGFDVDRVESPTVLERGETDAYDLVVVAHDETTTPELDGIAGVETAVAAVDCPVVMYAVGFPGADVAVDALDAGAADAVYVPPERESLLACRFRDAVTDGESFGPPKQLLTDFFEHFPEDVFVKDDRSRIAIGSHETTQPQGYDRDQLVGLTDYELFPPTLADALYEQEQRIRERESPEVDVVEHFVEDGEDRWISSTKVPRYDEDGGVTGIVGGTRDVTQLRRREKLVASLNEWSRDLMRAETAAGICQLTTAIAAEINTLPSAQVVLYDGHRLTPADTDDDGPALFDTHERWFWRAFETADPQYVTTRPDGRTTRTDAAPPDEIEAAVLPLGDHGALGLSPSDSIDEFTLDLANVFAATVEASLDRAQREQELREHERELATQNQRLEAFTTMVSHDLRNPLQVALGAAELLEEESEHVERIYTALNQMDRLVDELLALARQGEIVGDRVAVDVAELAGAAWGAVNTGEATLTLDDPGTVVADRDRLQELFENLFWVVLERVADDPTVRVGSLGTGGVYIEHAGRTAAAGDADPLSTRPLDTADWTQYGRYIVSTIAEAYGWDVTTVDTDGDHVRFEITGLEAR